MNIAVCISGHLRTIRQCYSYHYENILSKFNPDVFVHTWDNIESSTKSWHNSHMKNSIINEELLKFVEDRYQPKQMKLEQEKNFEIQGNQVGTSISLSGLKSMTYSMKQSYELKKAFSAQEKKKYDFTIKMRPDLAIRRNFLSLEGSQMLMYGNKRLEPIFYEGVDINYGALDCLFVYREGVSKKNPFYIYDSFDKFYCKDRFFHSPFFDYVALNKIDFKINDKVRYAIDWEIIRGA